MSIRLLLNLLYISNMLSNSISFLKLNEPFSSRRGVLIQILKNSEKQANNDEKIQFLTSCRHAKVNPKFIENCIKTSIYALGNKRGMRNIHEDYLRRTLSEAIKSAYRYRAYLLREQSRLTTTAQDYRLFVWTTERSSCIYAKIRMSVHTRLVKKFTNLVQLNARAEALTEDRSDHGLQNAEDNLEGAAFLGVCDAGDGNEEENVINVLVDRCDAADASLVLSTQDSEDAGDSTPDQPSGAPRTSQDGEIGKVMGGATSCVVEVDIDDDRWYDAVCEQQDAGLGDGKIVTDHDCWYDAVGKLEVAGEHDGRVDPDDDRWYDAVCNHEYTIWGGVICHEEWFDAVDELRHASTDARYTSQRRDTPPQKFANLSTYSLSAGLISLLQKGPSFAFSQTINKKTMQNVEVGLERGAFAVRWKEEIDQKKKDLGISSAGDLLNTTQDKPNVKLYPRFSDTDTTQAPQANPVTEHALKRFKQKVMRLYSYHQTNQRNHTKKDMSALTELQKDETVIVKRSDKCKGFVLMNKSEYIEKTEAIVKDYEPIAKNPTKSLDVETADLIKKTLKGKLPDKTIHSLTPNESRTAELYGLPKTHKPKIPMRPIVSACGDPIDKLSWLLEKIIIQLLAFVPAHLTNTYDYLTRLKTQFPAGFPAGAIAFTVDVNNLYGNIPTSEAIESTIKMLKTHSSKVDLFGLTIPDVKKLLEHCLGNNYLRFGKNFYKQTTGIAMGSRIAPPLAILFMDAVESLMLATDTHQPAIYLRYIDDIFGIWTHGSKSLDDYLQFMNSFHPSLTFSIERSDLSPKNQIPFLDTLLTVQPSGAYITELYIKPTAAPIILHFDSSHPMQTKRSIIHAQSLRAIRLGSDRAAQDRGLRKIEDIFFSNGYPSKLVRNIQNAIRFKNKDKNQTHKNSTTFISLPYIDEALTRKINATVKRSDLNIRIAWKSGPTLANKLTRSALEPPACPRGNRKSCSTCANGLEGRCHTKNVVYQIKCKICDGTYVGKTRRMVRSRFMEHLGDARNKRKGTDLGDHILQAHPDMQPQNDNFEICILQTCKDEANLKITESIEIRNRKPALNKNSSSWRLLHPLSYASFSEGR